MGYFTYAAVFAAIAAAVLLQDDAVDMGKAKAARRDDVYDVVPLVSPRVAGLPLKVFGMALRTPVLGDMIYTLLRKDNKLGKVDEFAATLNSEYMPKYYPVHHPTPEEKAAAAALPAFDINEFAKTSQPFQTAPAQGGFRYHTIADYTQRYQQKTLTPTDVAERVLKAITASDAASPPLRAFISVIRDDVMAQAAAATKRYAEGKPLGPLDGVPIAIKDEVDLQGHETTVGTSFLGATHGVAATDSIPAARLRAAGAVIIGKTNMHEIGIGTTGLNTHYGTVRNPYNPAHHTGGSSSGSAAAVASGLVPVALGLDGGGSVRIPSSLCGLVGVKATYGRVPCPAPDAPSVAHVGPMATSTKDAALVYAVISGVDTTVEESMPQPDVYVPTLANADVATQPLKGVRVGVYAEWFNDADDKDVVAHSQAAVDYLKKAGATIAPIRIPHLRAMTLAHGVTILTEMAAAMDKHAANYTKFCEETQVSLGLGRSFSAKSFLSAQVVRAYQTEVHRALFKGVDIIVSPTTAVTAPKIDPDTLESSVSDVSQTASLMKYIVAGNFVGVPAATVPVGYAQGLPVGLQLMADFWDEAVLFKAMKVLEGVLPNGPQRPQVYYDILA